MYKSLLFQMRHHLPGSCVVRCWQLDMRRLQSLKSNQIPTSLKTLSLSFGLPVHTRVAQIVYKANKVIILISFILHTYKISTRSLYKYDRIQLTSFETVHSFKASSRFPPPAVSPDTILSLPLKSLHIRKLLHRF